MGFGEKNIRKKQDKIRKQDRSYIQSDRYKENYKKSLLTRRHNKIPVYDCWVKNYGIEEANRLLIELKKNNLKILQARIIQCMANHLQRVAVMVGAAGSI